MAKMLKAGSGQQGAVGKVVILYGTVKAVSPDGTIRILTPNSQVFANDLIITESDGSVSIILAGPPPTHLDLGRMSQIVLDEDVYGGAGAAADAAAEADQIQQALLAGDEPIEPEAPAAGGEANAGGGHPVVNFALTGEEVTPESGAETRGILFPDLEVFEYDAVPESTNHGVEIFDLTPRSEGGDASVEEDDLSAERGLDKSPGSDGLDSTTTYGDFRVSAPDGLNSLSIDGHLLINGGSIVGGGTFTTDFGNTFTITGYNPVTGVITYSYTLEDNEQHDPGDGRNDMFEDLTVVATDRDGDSATGTLSIKIIDDVPTAKADVNTVTEGGTVTGNVLTDGTADVFGADGPAAG
ncbi:MAG: retention module-containing protein, partial [Syntrophales bacterium]